jgi:hypothetical protein
MSNPQNITWTGPTTYVDGLPYGQADHGGYEIEINGVAGVAVPVAWNAQNVYTFPVVDLPNIKQGTNALRMRTVAANGQVSDWTGSVTFPFLSVPKAPTNISVV